MSVKVMSLVWGWSLPATEKLVALKLADCADDRGGNAWPAVATIATDCGLSRRGAQKVLDRLRERGCIEVQAAATNRKSTTYRIVLLAQVPGVADVAADVCGGERGSPPEVNVVRPKESAGANGTTARGERGSPLGANVVRPIRPTPVRDPSEKITRVREDPRRTHPLDEPQVLEPSVVLAFDELWALYPRKLEGKLGALRAWHALHPSAEQAAFIVEAVRVRIRLGWARDTPLQFLPSLRTFIAERRWTQAYTPPAGASSTVAAVPNGLLVMRTCHACGAVQEGQVVNGLQVYQPCRCEPEKVNA